MSVDKVALRPSSLVMHPERAGAAFPNALSFARTGMAALVAGRWRIEKVRVELDAEGRGEVLYRFVGRSWTFHFFVVSIKLPEEVKLDRNFAQSWDAMGVLCQGEWTAEREQLLRQEVPKQRAGRADYDTLMYARGNRSGRLFEHVVESLAAGEQPDLTRLSSVGYILRTTAFIGNGQLGTRPLAGYEPDHPLREPYHAQIASGFLLREYVFDLVDVMARARSPNAARLCRSYRRYLGLGNSAATGLVAYLASHPLLVDRWQHTWECALAAVRTRRIQPGSSEAERLLALLRKAEIYFREAATASGEDIFTDRLRIAAELAAAAAAAELQAVNGGCLVEALWLWLTKHAAPETVEVITAILIETFPDVVASFAGEFQAQEEMELDPAMSVDDLRSLMRERFDWALGSKASRDTYFWYRASTAPRDVRRGFRGLDPALERETPMDIGLLLRRLAGALGDMAGDATIFDLVARHPDLRRIATRAQATANRPYADLRDDFLSASFSPFAPIRLILAFYGMDKFETARPKSVRGALLQGAPIAEDVAAGQDGDWPFPLRPSSSAHEVPADVLAVPTSSRAHPVSSTAIVRDWLTVAPIELMRASTEALVGAGIERGVADEIGRLVELAEGLCGDGARLLVEHLAGRRMGPSRFITVAQGPGEIGEVDAGQLSPWVSAPVALDLACATATRVGRAAVRSTCGAGTSAVRGLAIRAAERGFAAALTWWDIETGAAGVMTALPGRAARDCMLREFALREFAEMVSALGHDRLMDDSLIKWPECVPAGYVLHCARSSRAGEPADDARDLVVLIETLHNAAGRVVRTLSKERASWNRWGFRLRASLLRALEQAMAKAWLTSEEEKRVRPDGFDPLRSF